MISSEFISKILGVSSSHNFPSVTTDSRKITKDALFVALKGEFFDGHDFIPMALGNGAAGALCRKGYSLPAKSSQDNVKLIHVDDPLTAYRKLASAWRRTFKIPVIAVAGSVGKTTTKELIAAILRGKWPEVLKTDGSQNGFVGIPMTLFELRAEHGAAVIEIGIDEPGAMKNHLEIISPTASVVTAIEAEHLDKLKNIQTVSREECLALRWVADRGGIVAISADDPWIQRELADAPLSWNPTQVVFYSFSKLPELWQTCIGGEQAAGFLKGSLSGQELILDQLGLTGTRLGLPLPGKHNARNCLAAVAIARMLGMTSKEIQAGLKTFHGPDGRSQVKVLEPGLHVICDYYNASPGSVQAGLELLKETPGKTRWACLGDMLELGADEDQLHRDIAKLIIQNSLDQILLYGPRMKSLKDELISLGFKGQVRHFQTHLELAEQLLEGLEEGDVLLIKGSRGMKMEEVFKLLQERWQEQWKKPS